ncbi:MAG: class IV adenylate cyclase [Candidatus Hydrogenedentes bacterium]|nr:class IV adenylate cyclase [Candidatus Hydrogenedentota bacterium]
MRNIELKARLGDREHALKVCATLRAQPQGNIHQIDTYFHVPTGRLKLRENRPGATQLIFYRRPDRTEPKACDYLIEAVAPSMRTLLNEALSVHLVVQKVRALFLWRNVRIHLDQVQGLGDYLEFEGVVSDGTTEKESIENVQYLRRAFGIQDIALIEKSYLDLLLEARQAGRRISHTSKPNPLSF